MSVGPLGRVARSLVPDPARSGGSAQGYSNLTDARIVCSSSITEAAVPSRQDWPVSAATASSVAQDPERDRHASVAGQARQGVEGLSIASPRLLHECCVHPVPPGQGVVTSDLARSDARLVAAG